MKKARKPRKPNRVKRNSLNVKGHKIQGQPIRFDFERDIIEFDGFAYSLSEAKEYILKRFERLALQYKLKVLWDSKGRARILYCWSDIFLAAYDRMIFSE
ncbi:hypothetical protein [Nafulsella turpanensis]|uniref:hypothetical protein n=1 Tax=Nafulsella turpanensis TaxID=1265690 RepID=UPI00036CD034|nr:hypothetical protein [Nafulsella turpanensis]